MGTEITPSSRSRMFPPLRISGLPLGNNLHIPTTDQWAHIGTILEMGDSSYIYSKSGAVLLPGFGAGGYVASNPVAGEDITIVAAAAAVGDRRIALVNTANTITTNQYLDGYLVVNHGIATGAFTQFRHIVGNSASASTPATESIYFELDHPLDQAVAVGVFCEVMKNPYSDLRNLTLASDSFQSVLGVPASYVSAANMFFWLQTWGPCWINPSNTGVGDAADERDFFFVPNGTIDGGAGLTLENGYQRGGYIIQRDTTGASGPPFCMLQLQR
jgi:hypothetical protein